jgi:integrase
VPFSREDLSRVKEAKDPYKKVDSEIDRVNRGRLKAMPVSLTRTGGSLYVQGTFPPKPGEREPKQRRIPLKLKANVDFLFKAQNLALQIGADLMLGKWEWEEKEQIIEKPPMTVAEFADLHRKRYLDRNGNSDTQRDTLSYWKKDYLYPFNRLPQHKPPLIAICKEVISGTDNNTHKRNRYVKAYRQLLELAGMDSSSLKTLRGKYTAEQVQPRDIPDLKSIIEWGNKIPPQWKFYYFLLACFGLRGTEAHPKKCKLEDLAQLELMAYGKGRWRYVPSCSVELFTALNCPENWANRERSPGQVSDDFTKVLKSSGCNFTPYALRHHYAYHTLLEGWDTAWSAKCMGHSIQIHQQIYWLCINQVLGRKIHQKRAISSGQSSTDRIQEN